VIADPARLRLLSLIQAQPGHEACVCHLTEPLGLSQPTVSHHLKVLLRAGLVDREQRGSWAYFRVREEPLAALRMLLA
jgi:ArsR family transcriptional regulator